MKIIIAGAGEVGLHLSKLLSFESHDITLIDNNDINLKDGENYLDIKVINGDSSSISTLGQANVKDSDLVIGVTASESINFLTCSLSKQLGAKRTIARITNPEFISDNSIDFKKLGIDEIISPEHLAANEIKLLVNDSAFTNSHDFEDGELKMMAARIQTDAPFVGKKVQEAASVYPGIKFMPIAIERSGSQSAIIPRGNTLFKKDDHVYFITCDDGVDELYKLMGTKKDKLQNIMILGGGRVGFKVAQELSEEGYSVKLVEINNDKAEKIADQLNNVLVLNLDGTRVDLLSEENLDQMDAFISTTGDSQKNIMSCLMAKSKKIKKTIALVDDSDYFELSESIGVDTLINKKLLAANEIFRFIRKGNILELNKLNNMNAEVLEFPKDKKIKVSKNFELNHNNYWKIDDNSNDDQLKAITGICLMFGFLLVMGLFANLNLI